MCLKLGTSSNYLFEGSRKGAVNFYYQEANSRYQRGFGRGHNQPSGGDGDPQRDHRLKNGTCTCEAAQVCAVIVGLLLIVLR
jgi:hypothetical protein